MLKALKITLLLIFSLQAFSQDLLSPEKYFGQTKGSKFHFHHQIIEYIRYLSVNRTENSKLIQYGTTTEGRPQMVIAIGSKENILNLEKIRLANLSNIGLNEGPKNSKIPAIAYLSYNVHGNEANNAETSMYVIYELLKENSEIANRVFKNTLILIDPCVNPDGFDRYSQWYNRYLGQNQDLQNASVEHHEPWPGGRFNHYLFDMNRDLAWQTQHEVKQRIKFYNSWMPHLHADFHEMSPNSQYYFPPSAKPYHEDFTPYQRQFQELLGQYNKKRFDANGWLYFTKENYDLFYPSYGDTYPSYNGAIAMTFEQAGGGSAGLAYYRYDGDTLTLKDRIDHSFSTSMGTLEALSDNSEKTIEEFSKYFNDTKTKGFGKYKTYVLKNTNQGKIKALTTHLDRLQISYQYADKKTTGTGLNYSNQKEEPFAIEENDLLVSTFQTKGVLAKILFEPKSVLEDSNTYDITAWSLPYAYGLKAFASTQKINGNSTPKSAAKKVELNKEAYAIIIKYNSFEDAKLLSDLLRKGIKVRTNEMSFKANGKEFLPGSIIVTRKSNEKAFENGTLELLLKNLDQEYEILKSGLVESGPDLGANTVKIVKAPKIAMVLGQGITPTAAGEVWHFFDQQLNYPITIVDASYFARIDLKEFNVLILPSGSYSNIIRDHKELIKWVSDGGRLILLENANDFFVGKEGIELKSKTNASSKSNSNDKVYNQRERDAISDQIPGAIYKLKLDNTHPLAYGYNPESYILIKSDIDKENLSSGWDIGSVKEHLSGFAGKNVKDKFKGNMIFGVQDHGSGKIIYLLESPIFRGFWYEGKLLMANAVFMVR